jgi:hypothetical protein
VLAAAALIAATLTACAPEATRTEAAYCAAIRDGGATITDPVLLTETDVDALLDRYERIAQVAPIAVAPEWETMLATLRTASTLVPGDVDGQARVHDAALASQTAAERIIDYTAQRCALALG